MRKINLLLISVLMTAIMCTAVSAEEEYIAVSIGKKIESQVYGTGGGGTSSAANANDGNTGTMYRSDMNTYEEDSLTIDLEYKYKISYAEALFSGYSDEYEIRVSNDAEFGSYTVLEFSDGVYILPEQAKNMAFRYAKLIIPKVNKRIYVREFSIYTTKTEAEKAENGSSEFKESMIPVSIGKTILSKLYGTGGYLSEAKNANDGDSSTNFISATDKEDWLRIDLGAEYKITYIETVLSGYKGDSRVVASNCKAGQEQQFEEYTEFERGEDGYYYPPNDKKYESFRYIQLEKLETPGVDSMYVKEFTAFVSTRDMVCEAAKGKPAVYDSKCVETFLTDGDAEHEEMIKNAVIDLGAPMYIHSVKLFGTDNERAEILGSVFYDEINNMDSIGTVQNGTVYTNENVKCRYIAVRSAETEELNLSELKVYVFYDDIPGVWEVSDNGEKFNITVCNADYTEPRSYEISVALFDVNGYFLRNYSTAAEAKPQETVSAEIEVETDSKIYKAVCSLIGNGGKMIGEPCVFVRGEKTKEYIFNETYEESKEKDFVAAEEIQSVAGGVEMIINQTDSIMDSDIFNIHILSPSGNEVFRCGYIMENGKIQLSYYPEPLDEGGAYKIIISLTDAYGKVYEHEQNFEKTQITVEDTEECINAFKNTNAEDFRKLCAIYSDEKGCINLRSIPEIGDNTGKYFVECRNLKSKWNKSGDFSKEKDILDCIGAAVILEALDSESENAAEILANYSACMDAVFMGKCEYENIVSMYDCAADDIEAMINELRICTALGNMYGKAVSEIAAVLEVYGDALKIDVEKMKNEGINILEVAKKLDNTIPKSYKDGLDDEVDSIIEDLKPKSSISGGGGGGGKVSSTGVSGGSATGQIPVRPPESKQKVYIADVSESHWAYNSIAKMYEKGILSGNEKGFFEPDRAVTRAEFAKMTVLAFGFSAQPSEITPPDCSADDWFYPYVCAAYDNKIVKGGEDGCFYPNEPIKRMDAAVLCRNVINKKGYSGDISMVSFSDAESIAPYALSAVETLAGIGILNGMEDGRFNPNGVTTRAQAAVMISRLAELIDKQ